VPRLRPAELSWFFREARRRSPDFLARKAADVLRREVRSLRAALGGDPYAPRWHGRPARRPLLDVEAVDRLLAHAATDWPEELAALREAADRLAAGETVVLHHLLATPPAGEDWHRDFVSGRRWPLRFHTRYAYSELLDLEHPSDVKVPWEMSRLQALPALALAYRMDGEQRHLDALVERLISWRSANPVGRGINWTVGMEVALRAISLTVAADLLAGGPAEARLEEVGVTSLLAAHGRFLARNLEYSDVNGNHFTSCLVGLLVLGLSLPAEREATRWRDTAVGELRSAILQQVYPDGVCHEGSVPYHRLVLELFLFAALIARRGGLDLGADYHARLESMLDFTAACLRPDGTLPRWGDDDDGRVLRLTETPVDDPRGWLAAGGASVGRRDLVTAGKPSIEALLAGDDSLRSAVAAAAGEPRAVADSRSFPQAGFYVLRRGGDFCFVDCGDVGLRGRGGHGHNDALSCELVLAGLDVLTDTGCASYTRCLADRVATLGAASHNVATVAGREPAPISFDRFPHATACPIETSCWDGENRIFAGRHFGYAIQQVAGAYERRVELTAAGLRITDLIEDAARSGDSAGAAARGPVAVRWHFQLAERWQPAGGEAGWRVWRDGAGHRLRLDFEPRQAQASETRVAWYPGYGLRRERWRLVLAVEETSLPLSGHFVWRVE
jgi:hypothetical protein